MPTTPAITAAFDEAGRGWRSQLDLPVHRLALTSAEEYGSGIYLFIFDVYHWFGIGSGHCDVWTKHARVAAAVYYTTEALRGSARRRRTTACGTLARHVRATTDQGGIVAPTGR